MKLIFAPEAAEDMENIYCYYAECNENYAVELYNQFIEEAETLQIFPEIAPKEPLLEGSPEEYRSLIVRHNYKLVTSRQGCIPQRDAKNVRIPLFSTKRSIPTGMQLLR